MKKVLNTTVSWWGWGWAVMWWGRWGHTVVRVRVKIDDEDEYVNLIW